MEPFDTATVRAAYDTVAEAYATEFAGDLDRLPVDRAVLDGFASEIKAAQTQTPAPLVADVGCGPKHILEYLAQHGLDAVGIDLSLGMLRVPPKRTAPSLLTCADMRALPLRSQSCGGVVALYSIQHLRRPQMGNALAEFHRILRPDGLLVIATHLGDGEIAIADFLGHQVEPFGGTFYGDGEIEAALEAHSFVVEDRRYRMAMPHEHPSTRVYITARRAAGGSVTAGEASLTRPPRSAGA